MSSFRKKILTFCLFASVTLSLQAQKIMGYVEDYRHSNITAAEYAALTDVIYSFLQFDTQGNLIGASLTNTPSDVVGTMYCNISNTSPNTFGWDNASYTTVKSKCKTKKNNVNGPKLHIAVGGADKCEHRASRFYSVASNATTRDRLAKNLVDWAIQEGLYGIAVDWEFPKPNQVPVFELFMKSMRAAVNASSDPSIALHVAVGGEYKNLVNHLQYINKASIDYADELHIMSYDMPNTYSANHSTINDATKGIDQWNLTYQVPFNKMYLGIPFYGWDQARNVAKLYKDEPSYINAYNLTNEGATNGYYYNSKDAINKKIDYLYSKGCSGVIIWAIGGDRQLPDQYSLLGAVQTATDIACQAPQPDLGPDAGVCLTTTPGGLTLDSKVATASGRTFSWKKDGATIAGTNPTLTGITQGGKYEITVKQGTCSRTDEIIVTASNAVVASGGTVCGSGPVTLTATGSSIYKWYDALISGGLLATGSTYSPDITATTDFFVQDQGTANSYTTGMPVLIGTKSAKAPFDRLYCHKIDVKTSLKIASVDVNIGAGMKGNLYFELISSADNKSLAQPAIGPFAYDNFASSTPATVSFPINMDINPGVYYLRPTNKVDTEEIVCAFTGSWGAGQPVLPDYSVPNVINVSGNIHDDFLDDLGVRTAPNTVYVASLFNWVIVTGSINACGRTKVTATVNPAAKPDIALAVDSVCLGSPATVTIKSAEAGIVYQVFVGTTAIGTTVTGTGADIKVTIPAANLKLGENNITVKGTKTNCGTVEMTAKPVVLVSGPAKNDIASSIDSPICAGNVVPLTIKLSEKDVVYQAYINNVAVGASRKGTGADFTLGIPTATLTPASYTIVIKATKPGCSSIDLTAKATLVVSSPINDALVLTSPSPLCAVSIAQVTLKASELGIDYQPKVGSTFVGPKVKGTGADITLQANGLVIGSNKIELNASSAGCTDKLLKNSVTVVINAPASTTLTVSALSPVCQGASSSVTVKASETGVSYQAFIGTTSVGTAVVGTGSDITIPLPSASLNVGNNTIIIKATATGCGSAVNLTSQPVVVVGSGTNANLAFQNTSATVCKGTSANLVLVNAESGVSYQAFIGTTSLGTAVTGSGTNATIVLPSASLALGLNTITVKATRTGCGVVTLTNSFAVTVVDNASVATLVTVTSPVCQGTGSSVIVKAAQTGVSYEVFVGTSSMGVKTGANADLTFTIASASLNVGSNAISVKATAAGCGSVNLTATPTIVVNAGSVGTLALTSVPTVCQGSNGSITIKTSQSGISYQAFIGTTAASSVVTGTGADLVVSINSASLQLGNNTISVKATLAGCTDVTLTNTASIAVSKSASSTLALTSVSPICQGVLGSVTIKASELGVSYQAFIGTTAAGTAVIGTGTDLIVSIPANSLVLGSNSILIKATSNGCTAVDLTAKATIDVNSTNVSTSTAVTVSSNAICAGTGVSVTVKSAQVGVSYQACIGTTLIGTAQVGTGADIIIQIPSANLVDGDNVIVIKAASGTCTSVELTAQPKVTVKATVNETVSATAKSPICQTVNGEVTVASQKGVSYQVFVGTTAMGTPIVGTGSALVLSIPAANLAVGANAITVKATGCTTIDLLAKPVINVISGTIATNLTVTAPTTVCAGTSADVVVKAATTGVTYQAFINNNPIGTAQTGTGADLTFTIAGSNLTLGANTITVKATSGACGTSDLTSKPVITVQPSASTSLNVTAVASSICSGANGSVTVKSSETGISYQAFFGTTQVGTAVVGIGADITLTIPSASLVSGANTVSVKATGCNVVDLSSKALITVTTGTINKNLVVNAPTSLCQGAAATIVVKSAENGISYQASVGTTAVGTAQVGTGNDLTITIPSSNLVTGVNTISIKANSASCGSEVLSTSPVITVTNDKINGNLVITAPTKLCEGTSADVILKSSETGVSYQLFVGTTAIGTSTSGTGADVTFTIPSANLVVGNNTVSIKATSGLCASSDLAAKPVIVVQALTSSSLTVNAVNPTICSGVNGEVVVKSSQLGISYQAFVGTTQVGTAVVGTGADITLSIPASNLVSGANSIIVKGIGCKTAELSSQPVITVSNGGSSTALTVTAPSTICQGVSADVVVKLAEAGVSYQVFVGTTAVGSASTGTGADLTFTIPSSNLTVGANSISVKATSGTCGTAVLVSKPVITVGGSPVTNLQVSSVGTICSNVNGTVTVKSSQSGVSYQAFIGTVAVGGLVTGNGSDINLSIPSTSLVSGTNTIVVKATSCLTVELTNKATIVVGGGLTPLTNLTLTTLSPICQPQNGSVTVKSSQSGITYQCSIGGVAVGNSLTGNGADLTLSVSSSLLKSGDNVIGVKATGCSATVDLNSTVTINITTAPLANLKLTATSQVCEGNSGKVTVKASQQNVVYTASVNGKPSGASIIGNGSDITLNIPSSILQLGLNDVLVTARLGSCSSVSLASLPRIIVIKNQPLTGSNTINGLTSVAINSANVPYTVDPIAGATLYTWTFTGKDVELFGSGTQITANFASTSTNGTLKVVPSNACGVGSSSTLDIVITGKVDQDTTKNVSFEDSYYVSSISIAPNPFEYESNINLLLANSAMVKVNLTDMYGATIKQLMAGNLSAGTYSFPIMNVAAGVYFVQMQINGATKTYKVVKQ